jgi:L-ascorbate metabolism protein UlaG (beta-lactamase superfamily)
MRLTMVGQSTVIVELESGMVLLTDPWFESFVFMRGVPPAMGRADIPACDLLLVSHNHIDHFDNSAVRFATARGAGIIGSRRAAKRARKKGCPDVTEVAPGDVVERAGIKVRVTSAFHPLAKDAVGFIVEAEKSLYFSGDTRRTPVLAEEVGAFRIDVALVQVACSTYFGKEDGMNAREAAAFVQEIGAGLAVPIHYQVRGKVMDPGRFVELLPPGRGLALPPGVPVDV